jgi:hypothetical protein
MARKGLHQQTSFRLSINPFQAFTVRGWYPADFAFLEDPAIAKTKDADPSDSNIMTTSSVSKQDAASCHQVPVVNLEVGMAGKLTDKLLNDQLRKTERETEKGT